MIRWPLISCFVIMSGLGLGACSSSSVDGLTGQANLMGENDEMCQGATSPAGYSQCMRERYTSGSMGYDEEEGHFAPGSRPTSLFNSGN
jgi:hypothetical protein